MYFKEYEFFFRFKEIMFGLVVQKKAQHGECMWESFHQSLQNVKEYRMNRAVRCSERDQYRIMITAVLTIYNRNFSSELAIFFKRYLNAYVDCDWSVLWC